MLVIVINYLGVLPGGADNKYLLVGLVLITAGFITATQLSLIRAEPQVTGGLHRCDSPQSFPPPGEIPTFEQLSP